MRRLRIGWSGTSEALEAVRQTLEQYGHVSATEAVDVLIEDGSQPPPTRSDNALGLSLRLGIGPVTDYGLPSVQLRCYAHDQRVLAVQDVAEEPSGNGQRLRRQATNTLVEWIALLISGFARDTALFTAVTTANTWPEHSLKGLDALAFLHRFNRTAQPALLQAAQVPIIERLQTSLNTFAERTALNIAGDRLSYRQLHQRALSIQQRLRPLLKGIESPPVVGVCLQKSVELYASILAVLGCGAVYLPLAPEHPSPRHQAMLQSTKARLLSLIHI